MSINILDVDIDNLREKQYEELKKHAIRVLNRFAGFIQNDEFEKAEKKIFYSPAGDEMGCENNCINFAWNDGEEKDVYDILDKLKRLKKTISENKEEETKEEETDETDEFNAEDWKTINGL